MSASTIDLSPFEPPAAEPPLLTKGELGLLLGGSASLVVLAAVMGGFVVAQEHHARDELSTVVSHGYGIPITVVDLNTETGRGVFLIEGKSYRCMSNLSDAHLDCDGLGEPTAEVLADRS